jgi:hypothetical protein
MRELWLSRMDLQCRSEHLVTLMLEDRLRLGPRAFPSKLALPHGVTECQGCDLGGGLAITRSYDELILNNHFPGALGWVHDRERASRQAGKCTCSEHEPKPAPSARRDF